MNAGHNVDRKDILSESRAVDVACGHIADIHIGVALVIESACHITDRTDVLGGCREIVNVHHGEFTGIVIRDVVRQTAKGIESCRQVPHGIQHAEAIANKTGLGERTIVHGLSVVNILHLGRIHGTVVIHCDLH